MPGRSVLFVQYSSNRDGSAISGLLSANALKDAGWETHVVFGFDGLMVQTFEKAGHSVYVIPHKNWLRRSKMHHFLKDVVVETRRSTAFVHLIDDIAPALVYVNTVVSVAAVLAANRRRIPVLWHLREMFADTGGEMRAPAGIQSALSAVVRKLASHIIANSQATATSILGRSSERAAIVHNAVDESFLQDNRGREAAQAVLGVPQDKFLIGIPGSLRPIKGHDFFFRSVDKILQGDPNVEILVSGGTEGEYGRSITHLVAQLGISNRVRFLGWVEDMAAFYKACDVVCIPSRMEPFGRTIIEAYATGTPVIATNVGGIGEIVQDGKTGLLVPYGDTEALASAVRRLIADSGLRNQLSCEALEVARTEYDAGTYRRRICEAADLAILGAQAPTHSYS